jgi:holin-like protein
MLSGIFVIFAFQLLGEMIQQYFALTVPGPVIGLLLLLAALLLFGRSRSQLRENIETGLFATSTALLKHLPLLFVPIGVGVVMHVTLLEGQLLAVLAVIFVGTVLTIGLSALLMEKLQAAAARNGE